MIPSHRGAPLISYKSTHLVLQQNEGEDLEAHLDAEELEGQVERKVDEGEARVIWEGEAHRRLVHRREYANLDARLGRHGYWGAQQSQYPRLDLAHVVQDDRGGAIERLPAQHRPHVRVPVVRILSTWWDLVRMMFWFILWSFSTLPLYRARYKCTHSATHAFYCI